MTVSTDQIPGRTENDPGIRLRRRMAPFLVRHDERGLTEYLSRDWTARDLARLLGHRDAQVAQRAALALGLIGGHEQTPALARALHHNDYFVASMAERALWSVWFRASSRPCRKALRTAVRHIHNSEFDEAGELLDQILIADPDFAEASNQRAVLYYLTERFELSIMACQRTLMLNPYHFGAAAGLGHNLVHLGQHAKAIGAYRRAMAIHPRMEGVRQSLRQARDAAAREHAPRECIVEAVIPLTAATDESSSR